MNDYRMGTKCVQAGYTPGNGEPRQVPIIQSTTFKYSTSEDMGKLFDLEADGYFIQGFRTRRTTMWQRRLQLWRVAQQADADHQWTGGKLFCHVQYLSERGHIVASSSIYGGTFNLIGVTMAEDGNHSDFRVAGCDRGRVKCCIPAEYKAHVWRDDRQSGTDRTRY